MEVHRHKGPGLIESIYERCLLRELELCLIPATTQKLVRVEYKGLLFDEPLRFDILVDDCLLVELKAVEILHPSSKALSALQIHHFSDITIFLFPHNLASDLGLYTCEWPQMTSHHEKAQGRGTGENQI